MALLLHCKYTATRHKMPISIRMTQTRQGDAGAVLTSGQTYSVRDQLGNELVGAKYAVSLETTLPSDTLNPIVGTPAQQAAFGGMVSGGGILTAGSTARQAQDLLTSGTLRIVGNCSLDSSLLLGSDSSLTIDPDVTVSGSGSLQHNFARTGNAEYLASGIPGIWVVCATERTAYGEGSIVYTHSGTTLTYAAPGDSAGSAVSIASVVSVATSGIVTLTSANGTDQLHVVVFYTINRNANSTHTLRIEPVTGAKAMTWVRNGATLVATEAGHTRRVGDFVMSFGALKHGFITAADATTWAIPDATGASSGSGQAYGVRNVRITTVGAKIDGNHGTLANTNLGMHNHAFVITACNSGTMELGDVEDFQKYVFYASGGSNLNLKELRSLAGDCADTVHVVGPYRGAQLRNIRAKAIDNIVGIGCCDYLDYVVYFPTAGPVDVETYTIENITGIDSTYELVRLYNANSGVLRDGKISGVHGTYGTSTSAAVTIITDSNASQVDGGATNIDGLVVDNITAVRSDGSHSPAFWATGTGTRRGVSIDETPARAATSAVTGTVVIDSVFEDFTVSPQDGNPWAAGKTSLADASCGFSGAYFHLRGSGRVKHLTLNCNRRMRGNNQLPVTLGTGSATTPCILQLESAAAQVDNLHWIGGYLDDISGSGTKLVGVRNVGVIALAEFEGVRQVAGDALWRQLTGSNAATQIYLTNCDIDATYLLATDVAVAVVKMANTRMRTGTGVHMGSASGTYRIDASNCTFDSRFVRNSTGNNTVSVRAVSSSAGTPLQVDAGTPSIRLAGDWDMTIDGALIDATVANHGAGAKFYNSAAGFGAGVGAYVRGSATWTRIAA